MEKRTNIEIDVLVDFALGKLSAEESLVVVDILEKDPEASEMLETIVELMNHFAEPNSEEFKRILPLAMKYAR